MRILYLVHQFFPNYYTGTERLTLDLASQMQRTGHYPLVLTYDPDPGDEGFADLQNNVKMKRYKYQSIPVISLKQTPHPETYGIFHPTIEKAFNKLGPKCDVIHICHPKWLSAAVRTCEGQKCPIVLTLTDPWLLCPRETLIDRESRLCDGPESGRRCVSTCGFQPSIADRYRNAMALLDMADHVVTSSSFTASLFKRNGWNGDIRIVRHSIDYRFVKPDHSDSAGLTFGYIGTIAPHKGLHVLLTAFRKVASPRVTLRVHGSIHQHPDYSTKTLRLAQGDNRIRFLQPFDISDLPTVMKSISVLVVPSIYYENYPLVLLIAQAYKVPVIASKIGGMPEVIQDGINGFLFEPGDSNHLATIIEKIAEEPDIVQRLRENIMSPRRLEEEALDYENIYRTLTSH